MLKRILLILGVVLVALLVLIAMQPGTFRVARSATVSAPPAAVFAMVNDFHKWDAWSPWAKLDPNMKTSYEGPAEGTGAIYSWVGNDKVGEGRMTILESRPAELVRIKLEFLKPFPSTNTTEFTFKGDNQTNVDWVMTGDHNFMSKAMSLFMGGMDGMIGPDFEKGLKQMKAAAESR